MKKASFLLLALVIGGLSTQKLTADILYPEQITVKGTIEQAPPTLGADPVVYDLSKISDIFAFMGIVDDPTQQRWYWDSSLQAYVIAPKGFKNGDSGTPTLIVYDINSGTYGTDYVEVKTSAGHETGSGGGDFALAGNLPATAYYTFVWGNGHETDTFNFIAYGKVNGVNTIMKGTIKDGYKL